MPRLAANLTPLFTAHAFCDRFTHAAGAGLSQTVEVQGLRCAAQLKCLAGKALKWAGVALLGLTSVNPYSPAA